MLPRCEVVFPEEMPWVTVSDTKDWRFFNTLCDDFHVVSLI